MRERREQGEPQEERSGGGRTGLKEGWESPVQSSHDMRERRRVGGGQEQTGEGPGLLQHGGERAGGAGEQ